MRADTCFRTLPLGERAIIFPPLSEIMRGMLVDMRNCTVPCALRQPLLRALAKAKITFLCAGAGWGKTTVARELLNGKEAVYIRVERGRTPRFANRIPLVVLDDLQNLGPSAEERLAGALHHAPRRQRFLLLSRTPVPERLAPYHYTGDLRLFQAEDLALQVEDAAQLAMACCLKFTAGELRRMVHEAHGYPPLIRSLLEEAAAEGSLSPRSWEIATRRVWDYLDAALYESWSEQTRMLLLSLCRFLPFHSSLAGDILEEDPEEPVARAARDSGVLFPEPGGWWHLSDRFLLEPYLRQKAERVLSGEQIRRLCRLGGAWCAEHGDHTGAVRHFADAGSRSDVISALVRAVREQADADCLRRLYPTFQQLSGEEAAASPELLYALSRLAGLMMEPESAGMWYQELNRRYGGSGDERADSYVFHLDLCLSGRDGPMFSGHPPAGVSIPSVTAGLPSVLRGERDISDDLLRNPHLPSKDAQRTAEKLLGRHGVALGALLQAELRLERCEDAAGLLLQWHSLQLRLREEGTLDNEFVCAALMARYLCAEGQLPEAAAYLTRFRQRAETAGAAQILQNLDALRCRLSLMEDSLFTAGWFAAQTPGEDVCSVPDLFCLLTKVRCHIQREEYHAALLILGQLMDCLGRVSRPLDTMESLTLTAICRLRMGGRDAADYLGQALGLGVKYGYAAVLAREGAALFPLLEQGCPKHVPPDYWRRLLRHTASYAKFYPYYLKPLHSVTKPLTPTEGLVFQFLSQHKTNEEIARLLGIQAVTVRTHLLHIYEKLGVSGREEARIAAMRLH